MPRKLTLSDFIERSSIVHNHMYDYSQINVYRNSLTKVPILCKVHGTFLQAPAIHLSGHGCPTCGGGEKSSIDVFIRRAKKKHGDKYDYSLGVYKTCKTKLQIICPQHGMFLQTPSDHLNGYGCPRCSNNVRLGIGQFIEKATLVHKNRYDYSLIHQYTNNHTKVPIVCKEHGPFLQTPHDHLSGAGCPWCVVPKNELLTGLYLQQLLPPDEPLTIHEKIVVDTLACRSYILVDYSFRIHGQKYIVEYNGKQHYEPGVSFWGSEPTSLKRFEEQQSRDAWLRAYCEQHGIKLIEIDGRKCTNLRIKKFLSQKLNLVG